MLICPDHESYFNLSDHKQLLAMAMAMAMSMAKAMARPWAMVMLIRILCQVLLMM